MKSEFVQRNIRCCEFLCVCAPWYINLNDSLEFNIELNHMHMCDVFWFTSLLPHMTEDHQTSWLPQGVLIQEP